MHIWKKVVNKLIGKPERGKFSVGEAVRWNGKEQKNNLPLLFMFGSWLPMAYNPSLFDSQEQFRLTLSHRLSIRLPVSGEQSHTI